MTSRHIIRTPRRIAPSPTTIVRQRDGVRYAFHRLLEPTRDVVGEVFA